MRHPFRLFAALAAIVVSAAIVAPARAAPAAAAPHIDQAVLAHADVAAQSDLAVLLTALELRPATTIAQPIEAAASRAMVIKPVLLIVTNRTDPPDRLRRHASAFWADDGNVLEFERRT